MKKPKLISHKRCVKIVLDPINGPKNKYDRLVTSFGGKVGEITLTKTSDAPVHNLILCLSTLELKNRVSKHFCSKIDTKYIDIYIKNEKKQYIIANQHKILPAIGNRNTIWLKYRILFYPPLFNVNH